MTKAISDVDDCVEGMRKFTTEVFDTGVALAGYVVMLLVYDWRLALLQSAFHTDLLFLRRMDEKTGAACRSCPIRKRPGL